MRHLLGQPLAMLLMKTAMPTEKIRTERPLTPFSCYEEILEDHSPCSIVLVLVYHSWLGPVVDKRKIQEHHRCSEDSDLKLLNLGSFPQ